MATLGEVTEYKEKYSPWAKKGAEARQRHEAAVAAAKKRQSDPRFRRTE
jgi:hypothetical protein